MFWIYDEKSVGNTRMF